MHYVYIIRSEVDGSFYSGYTSDPRQRMIDHNSGKNKSTKSKKPWKLVTYLAFSNKKRALDFESYLKTGSGLAFAVKRLR